MSEVSSQFAAALREMPSHGHPADAKERGDRGGIEFLDLVHHDHRPSSRRQTVERFPDHRVHDEGVFRIDRVRIRSRLLVGVASANVFPSPLVASHVHEHADEPRFFILRSVRDGFRDARRFQEGVLNQIARLVCGGCQTTGEAIKTGFVGVEQRRQPRDVLWPHISLNARR